MSPTFGINDDKVVVNENYGGDESRSLGEASACPASSSTGRRWEEGRTAEINEDYYVKTK